MTLGERVRAEREAKRPKWSQAELARRVSLIARRTVTQVAIHHIESRGNVTPRFLDELAEALGVTTAWLKTGREPKLSTNIAADPLNTRTLGVRPLVAASDPIVRYRALPGGGGGRTLIYKENTGIIDRPDHLRYAKNAFGYEIPGDDFAPVANPRDVVIVDPDRPVKPGDDCLFVRSDGEQIEGVARRLISASAKAWTVRRFLPKVQDEDLSKAEYAKAWAIVVIHRV